MPSTAIKIKERERDVQASICDYLALKGYLFWRNNNTPIFDTHRGIFRAMPKYGMKGLPDINLIKDGKFIGLEVKRKGGVPSEHQMEFMRKCIAAGADYFVVHSIEEVQKIGL